MDRRKWNTIPNAARLAIIILAVAIPLTFAEVSPTGAVTEDGTGTNITESGMNVPSETPMPSGYAGEVPIPPQGTGAATMPPEFAPPANAMQGGGAMPYPSGIEPGTEYRGGTPSGAPQQGGTKTNQELLLGMDENTILYGALGLGALMILAYFLLKMKGNKEDEIIDQYREKYGRSL